MKKTLIIIFSLILAQFAIGQSKSELREMWNSEVIRVGDKKKDQIETSLETIKPQQIELASSNYTKGILKIYRTGESIEKMTKSYRLEDVDYIEHYYFLGQWPLYVEIHESTERHPDKFYFDKTNLMLWIDSENNHYSVENKECNDRWWHLLESMEKLQLLAQKNESKVNEDVVQIPEPPPMTEEDSLELLRLKEEIEEIMKAESEDKNE